MISLFLLDTSFAAVMLCLVVNVNTGEITGYNTVFSPIVPCFVTA